MPKGNVKSNPVPVLAGALFAVLSVSPPPALGQTELEAIVVEGASLDFTPEATSSVGSAVTVVTGEELERRQVRSTGDALRSLPGVHIGRTGAFGGLTEIRLRGAESNHTLVLIDGVEANATTNGLFSFSDLSVENIERIEVVRGPQSGLFGSSALAGVVNIVTKNRRGPLQATVRQEAGGFETTDTAVSVSGGTDEIYTNLTVHGQSSNGFNIAPEGIENDSAAHQSILFKGGVKPTGNTALDFMVRRVNKKGDRDNEGGAPGTFAVQVDTPSNFETDILLARGAATLETFGGRWVHTFSTDLNETFRSDTDVTGFGTSYSRNDSRSRRHRYLTTVNGQTPRLGGATHRLTGMIEQEIEEFTPQSADGITRSREALSVAADYHGEFFGALNLHGAVRHDDNDTLPDFETYRLGGSLRVPQTPFRVHGSAGTGVKAPTMFEQFGVIPASFVPNPDLQPEESFGWDAGVEMSLPNGRGVLDVTWFEADLTNEIATLFLPGFRSTPVNLDGKSERKGLEVSGRLKLTDWLEVGGDFTRLQASEPDGELARRRPKHSGRAFVNASFAGGRGNLSASAAYNGEMIDFAFLLPLFTATRVTLDDYTLVSVAGSYEVRPGIELFARGENVLDEDYQEVFGFASPGAAVFGGLRLTLGGREGAFQ